RRSSDLVLWHSEKPPTAHLSSFPGSTLLVVIFARRRSRAQIINRQSRVDAVIGVMTDARQPPERSWQGSPRGLPWQRTGQRHRAPVPHRPRAARLRLLRLVDKSVTVA